MWVKQLGEAQAELLLCVSLSEMALRAQGLGKLEALQPIFRRFSVILFDNVLNASINISYPNLHQCRDKLLPRSMIIKES